MKAIQFPATLCVLLSVALTSISTTSCTFSVEKFVAENDLTTSVRSGTHYRHIIFRQHSDADSGRLHIYIGGDGKPWTGGLRPAIDPTPDNPLALRLMTLDPANAVFVGRPCSFGLARDAACNSDVWTFARYSPKVIYSMLSVIRDIVADGGYTEIIIVGYSGGGAIARLVATDFPQLSGLLTINANLDIDAWTRIHGYLPLTGSQNPSDALRLPAGVLHVQAVGSKDKVVPPSITATYQSNDQEVEVWQYPDFDHVCCWLREWPVILSRFEARLVAHAAPEY